MFRKIWIVLISMVFVLAACGGDESGSDGKTKDSKEAESSDEMNVEGVVKQEEIDKLYTNPTAYKGYEVELTGQVFHEPESDDEGVYFQMFADPENSEKNTIIGVEDTGFNVKTSDYVQVKGIITDAYEGENAFGGTVEAPAILAREIEVVDYTTAVAPTQKTIPVDKEVEQHGYSMLLDKIEIAENQTRVFLKISNQSDDPISFYSFDARILVGNKQLEEMLLYETDLPTIQDEILPGVETEGVITFPAIEENTKELTFHAEGSSENYDVSFDPFIFEVDLQ